MLKYSETRRGFLWCLIQRTGVVTGLWLQGVEKGKKTAQGGKLTSNSTYVHPHRTITLLGTMF